MSKLRASIFLNVRIRHSKQDLPLEEAKKSLCQCHLVLHFAADSFGDPNAPASCGILGLKT